MPPAVAIRPRSVSELVDAAFQVLRGSFGQLFLLSTVIIIPNLLIGLVNRSLMPSLIGASGRLSPDEFWSNTALLWIIPLGIVGMCWFFVGMGALVGATSDAYLGRQVNPPVALGRSISRAATLIGSNLLAYLLVMLGVLGLGIAAAIVVPLFARMGAVVGGVVGLAALVALIGLSLALVARYFVITPVVMLEQGGPIAALRRSVFLTAGSRLRIVGLISLIFVLSLAMLLTIFAVAGSILGNPYMVSAIATLFWLPVYPLGAAIITLLYYDLRIRKEAFDIELMASGLGAPAGQPA